MMGVPYETILLFGSIIGYTIMNIPPIIWILTALLGNFLVFFLRSQNQIVDKGIFRSYPILVIAVVVSMTIFSGHNALIYLTNAVLGIFYMYLLRFSKT